MKHDEIIELFKHNIYQEAVESPFKPELHKQVSVPVSEVPEEELPQIDPEQAKALLSELAQNILSLKETLDSGLQGVRPEPFLDEISEELGKLSERLRIHA